MRRLKTDLISSELTPLRQAIAARNQLTVLAASIALQTVNFELFTLTASIAVDSNPLA